MAGRIKILAIAATLMAVVSCGKKGEPVIELRYDENISLDYHEVIEAYSKLADHYSRAELFEMGMTDVGKPLHLFMISGNRIFDPETIKRRGKSILLINNGIHSGEPVGIDASIEFAMEVLQDKEGVGRVLENTVIAIIPLYNIGGSLNRSRFYRLNQDGPIYKGARRNARNLDLNRDFVKKDSRNAFSFAEIFHYLDPDVFLDTHTTNGSDHQFTMTLIPTMHQKLPTGMDSFFREEMVASLYERMNNETPWGMVPYVQTAGRRGIRSGITAFNDHPYYSTGYTVLFNTFGFMTENLVHKPFPDRVRSTLDFMRFLAAYTNENSRKITELRREGIEYTKTKKSFVLDWSLDRTSYDNILFKGYETEQVRSPITNRLTTHYHYDRKWSDTIPFYNYFTPRIEVEAPDAYIIPHAWGDITERMIANGVEVHYLERDTVINVESILVSNPQYSQRPTQGRFLINNANFDKEFGARQFYRGDAVIYVNQRSNNYIVHMLEPEAPASFFRWGFFTSSLEGGEFFSIWGFESHAYDMLQDSEELRELFERRMEQDEDFANDPVAQLQFIYDQVPQSDVITSSNIYPVARLISGR